MMALRRSVFVATPLIFGLLAGGIMLAHSSAQSRFPPVKPGAMPHTTLIPGSFHILGTVPWAHGTVTVYTTVRRGDVHMGTFRTTGVVINIEATNGRHPVEIAGEGGQNGPPSPEGQGLVDVQHLGANQYRILAGRALSPRVRAVILSIGRQVPMRHGFFAVVATQTLHVSKVETAMRARTR